jgi:hypothetical protein
MNPKEKAQELLLKFKNKHLEGYCFTSDFNPQREQRHLNEAKGLALIAVDEILNLSKIASLRRDEVYMELEYWMEVKQEIEKL